MKGACKKESKGGKTFKGVRREVEGEINKSEESAHCSQAKTC